MSEANETNALWVRIWSGTAHLEDAQDLSSKLEGERDEARSERDAARAAWYEMHSSFERSRDEVEKLIRERDEALETLHCLLAVIGLTPIAGNKQALQEAVDLGFAVLRKKEGEE